ncbi:hypothetical protein LRS12_04025 [Sphingomonas sp. J344]|nr:hypothetical protein [Sphingomonas sp. J344]MCR5869982.1 hypothetical protein [Sphingomonas sp. J344]
MRAAIFALALTATGCSDRDPHRSGTIDGPLSGSHAISERASGGETLAGVGQEGLRVLIAPSFGRYAYYLSLRRLPKGCVTPDDPPKESSVGRICGPSRIDVRRFDQFDRTVTTARFFLPPWETHHLLEELDARLDGWSGRNSGGTDGTWVKLERVRNGQVTSMSSNDLPDPGNPAAQLSGDLLRILLSYGPSGFAPRSGSWDVRAPGESAGPCDVTDLATPLDRGFGSGNSDCDATKRWP